MFDVTIVYLYHLFMSEILNNRLLEMRKAKNLTQIELAEAVSVTRQTIISIEKGNYVPSVLLAIRLSRVLEVEVEKLFFINNLK